MKLTVLSMGAGQDSYTILLKYIYDPGFRQKYAPEAFLVVMSDTGDEHWTTDAMEWTTILIKEVSYEQV